MSAHTTETYKGYTIEIHNDDDPFETPRDWDNLGFMAFWHRRMWLGDKPKEVQKYSPDEWFRRIVSDECWKSLEQSEKYEAWVETRGEYDNADIDTYIYELELEELIEAVEKDFVILPVHAYEHGGITISTGRFSCMFDSGQLGWIYVSKKDAMKEFSVKVWSKELEKKVIAILEGEVETYDQYLTGDIHGYKIYAPDDENCDDELHRCWGFYGSKDCMDEAKSQIDWYVENSMNNGLEMSQTLPIGIE